jgi:endonuclease/exonuclease/phosphatase (EEP) superfamily protein YafD
VVLRTRSDDMQFTVMTYNVGNGLARSSRLAGVLRQAGADVVGLQEVSLEQARGLTAELEDVYPHRVLLPEGFAGKGVLSRFPLVSHERLALYPDRPDLAVSLEVEGTMLRVVVGHPPPPRLRGARVVFDSDTLLQLEELASRTLEHIPSVLLGDFNMTQRNRVYAQFAAAGLTDAFAVAGVGRGWTLPVRVGHARIKHRLHRVPLRPVARVDYIWYTRGLAAEAAWVGADAGSDHLPVLARLTLSAE